MKVIAGLTISLSLFLGVTIADANCSGKAVDGTCVYGKYDGTIASEKFNETSQICTISGIHEKYNGGLEIRCCGNGTYRPEIEICIEGKVCLINNKTNDRPDQPYSSLTHKCCGHMVKKIEERCRKGSRNFPKEIRHLWRSWLRKTKHKNLQIMYIHINKATIFPEVKQPEN
uniref:Uncharacterized protein LOC111105424 n=1 Tax=Crassostrea virginica TaxID=6565 RepID=A0A8B8AW64_CRAVI|nr:uncharacterized protein LOC111105424 [Crassostrea virginica]